MGLFLSSTCWYDETPYVRRRDKVGHPNARWPDISQLTQLPLTKKQKQNISSWLLLLNRFRKKFLLLWWRGEQLQYPAQHLLRGWQPKLDHHWHRHLQQQPEPGQHEHRHHVQLKLKLQCIQLDGYSHNPPRRWWEQSWCQNHAFIPRGVRALSTHSISFTIWNLFRPNIVPICSKKFDTVFGPNNLFQRQTTFVPNDLPNCWTNWQINRPPPAEFISISFTPTFYICGPIV